MIDKKTYAMILAAGKGTRMNSTNRNKVVLELGAKPMICYGVDLLQKVGFKKEQIVLVVGFASETVKKSVGKEVKYVFQKKQLGTGNAVRCGLKILPASAVNILVMNGDDSAFYREKTIKNLIKVYEKEKPAFAFLSLDLANPQIARVVRDHNGQVLKIVEQQDITAAEKAIKEVNCGCYVFAVDFLKKYLPRIKLSRQGEYYLTSLFELAVNDKLKIVNYKLKNQYEWVGVNTPQQLEIARQLKKKENLC